jgi:hypothetical protein
MLASDATFNTVSFSAEKIIEIIRDVRNDMIKDLMSDEVLNAYYFSHFNKELSNIKREFIRRDLRELRNSPLDLVHYSKLITFVKQTGTFIVEKNTEVFYNDFFKIVNKYSV